MSTLILMTALVPTTGHLDLIRFARNLPGQDVYVLVQGRSFEPVPLEVRVAALRREMGESVTVLGQPGDDSPQVPGDHPDFWGWWRDAVRGFLPQVSDWDYVVASEPYGIPLARALGADFLPYDLDRSINPVQGEQVRRDPAASWSEILPGAREHLSTTITLFGQESVGKTTVSRLVAQRLGATWLPEYARPYLETVGTELGDDVMGRIADGQYALQVATRQMAPSVDAA